MSRPDFDPGRRALLEMVGVGTLGLLVGFNLPAPEKRRFADTRLPLLPEFRPPTYDQNIVVVMLRKPEDAEPIAPEALNNILNNDVSEFYRLNSYGQVNFRFTVLPWHSDNTVSPINHDRLHSVGNTVLAQAGIDKDQFQSTLYVVPDYLNLQFDKTRNSLIDGQGNMSSGTEYKYAWLYPKNPPNGFNFRSVAIHELAHNLGLSHRSFEHDYNIEPDIYEEYDSFWVTYPFLQENNFTAVHKIALGWIGRDQVQDVQTSGIYELTPHDVNKKPPGILALRLRVPDSPLMYYVDAVSPPDSQTVRLHAWDDHPNSFIYDLPPLQRPDRQITFYDPKHDIRVEQLRSGKVKVTLNY